jgi:pSer/pThr/pTyr-binding forkhead associated (FHA) protein
MESICPICKKPYDGVVCTQCTVTDLDVSGLMASEGLQVESPEYADDMATAFLVDLVSNRKIPITTPRCKVGRDDLNDIVISGDQSISRFHFVITKENNQYFVQDGKSRHGTFLNGNQITAPEPIHDGDVLKVGVSLFWFVIENAQSASESGKIAPVDIDVMDQRELEFMVPEPAQSESIKPNGRPDRVEESVKTDSNEAGNAKQLGGKGKKEDRTKSNRKGDLSEKAGKEDIASGKGEKVAKTGFAKNESTASPLQKIDEELSNAASGQAESKKKANEPDRQVQSFNPEPALTKAIGDELQSSLLDAIGNSQPQADASELAEYEKDAQQFEMGKFTVFEPTAAIAKDEAQEQASQPSEGRNVDLDESISTTFDKFAEVLGNPGSEAVPETQVLPTRPDESESNKQAKDLAEQDEDILEQPISREKDIPNNGAKSVMTIATESTGVVPDWCKKYFSTELSNLNKELTDLNEQVRRAQQKIKDVEAQVTMTKGLRDTLLAAQGEELVEACAKVLRLIGWQVKISDDDKHELRLDSDDKNTSIVRIVWTETQADRTHLGQLSISQTRQWCEQGVEPKGILIISKTGENGPSTLTQADANSELAEYATKKNVCLMTTLQLLAVYKEVALREGSPESIRATMVATNGWLSGYNLEPGEIEKDETPTNKLSSLLSA